MNVSRKVLAGVLSGGGPQRLFRYDAGAGVTGLGGTFSRADATTCATYVDANGIVQTVAANVLRDGHYIGGVRTALLEGARTNLVVQSGDMTAANGWTVTGGTATAGASTVGILSYTSLSSGVTDHYRGITLTGDGVKAYACYFTAGSGNCTFDAGIYDNTAAAWRCRMAVTVTGSVVSAVAVTGTLVRVEALGFGQYRVLAYSTPCTAANTNLVYTCYKPGGLAASVLATGQQVEDAAFPSSYIATAGSAVTRAADALSFPFGPVPQALTVYADGYELGTVLGGTTAGVFDIGNSGNESYFLYNSGSNVYRVTHRTASDSNAMLAAAPSFGDRVELRAAMASDGSHTLGQTINAGSETTATGGANAFTSAFAATTMQVGNRAGSVAGFFALRRLVVAAGVQSLATMRAL